MTHFISYGLGHLVAINWRGFVCSAVNKQDLHYLILQIVTLDTMATSISLVQFCTLNGRQHWFWGSQQGQELEPGRGRLEGDRSAAPPCNCYHFVVTIVRIFIIIIIIKRGTGRQHHLILEDHHQVKFLVIEEKNKISKPNPLASMCV